MTLSMKLFISLWTDNQHKSSTMFCTYLIIYNKCVTMRINVKRCVKTINLLDSEALLWLVYCAFFLNVFNSLV